MFEIKTKRHSKKKGIVYASNEGLALLRQYGIFIAINRTHDTNKARFTLLNVYV